MDDKRFWDIIAVACKIEGDDPDFEVEWYDALVEQLVTLPHEDIVRFDRWFDDRTDALYTRDHWGAAYLINGGASDDGFYYFRCWLVGMGKRVYEAALKDPDTLADVVNSSIDYEAEIYSVARAAWERLGLDEDDFDRAYKKLGRRKKAKLKGEDWAFNDDEEMRRRLPRLFELYDFNVDDDFEDDDWE